MTDLLDNTQVELKQFINQTIENNLVWGLMNKEEEWLCVESTEFEASEVIPFWSNEADAKIHNVEEWKEFVVTAIPLDVFTQEWLVTLDEDGVLLGINWDAELQGQEIEPASLAKLYL